jgi:hypothetical protein
MEPATENYPAYARPRRLTVARTGLIVFIAVLLEVVIIAAADNQWVGNQLVKAQQRTDREGLRLLEGSWLTYTWRFTPRDGLTNTWWSELALILTVLVVSGLLVGAIVRGPVTFVRAFFGSWMAVIVASLLGAFVRGLIDPASATGLPGVGRVTRAAFAGPSGSVAIAGLGLGFVVALITAAVAVTTRRPADRDLDAYGQPVGPAYVPPEQPPPFFGTPAPSSEPSGMRPWQDQRYGPPLRQGEQPTTQLPPPGSGDQQTTQLPRTPEGDQPTTQLPPPGEGEQATTRFPRPPDEDL